ncbi:MAG: hypothetical protein ACR2FY_17370 [Pirellulaceae bacterium]
MSQGSPYGSQPNPFGNQNPYTPPQGQWGQPQGQWGQPAGYTPGMPGFCKAMFIVSLVFCFLRAAIVALGFVGMGMLPADDPAMKMAYFEIGTGLGMVLCGVPGNALLLAKNQIGVFLGWGLVAFTVGSILTGLATVFMMGNNPAAMGPPPPPGAENAQFIGMMIGGAIAVLVRVGIIVAYGAALIQFQNWYAQYGRNA